IPLPDRLLEVVDDSTGWGREQRHRVRQEGQRALACGRECALGLEPPLQLFEPRAQLAHVVELDLVDDESDGAVLGPEIDATPEYEHLAVLWKGGHASCV